jgi:Ser/Thr protein kinase RdoA (MazF antagonist)
MPGTFAKALSAARPFLAWTDRRAVTPVRLGIFRLRAAPVLRRWGIRRFTVVGNLGGQSRASWRVDADGRSFVLRRIVGGRDYLSYQLDALAHLAQASLPVELPRPQATLDGARIHDDGAVAWILYPFVDGAHPDLGAYRASAREVGVLVGRFDRAVATLDLGARTGSYRLALFDEKDILRKNGQPTGSGRAGDIATAIEEFSLERILAAYDTILPAARDAVAALPLQTVYNDWHPRNMLARDGRIVGLIDFDSLVEAPRVVDVQNALGYLLMHCETPDQAVARSFLNGYESVAALSSREHSLVWLVMMDRLLWLTADILLEKQRKGRSARERLGRRALRLLDWLVDSGLARPPALD